MWPLAELATADLKPSKIKFLAFATTPGTYHNAPPPDWLGRPFFIASPTP
jgi:hypothetical protein